MIQQVAYDLKDIEKFLEINSQSEQEQESQIFKKLLGVQNRISILADIDPEDLKIIVYNLNFVKYNYKDIVIKEGDISQEIFFVLSGECQVFLKQKKVGVIKAGNSFGESAAVFNTKRNATVISSSEKTTVLSFCIDHDNMMFCAPALATIYKNLAFQINSKLELMNSNTVKK